jgi:sterol desaturase/sphingolipid hydroxylase (fatty acid hydroxylase superfamily)
MTNGPDERDDDFGSELRKRASPRFAREQRRKNLWAGVVGIVIGLVSLAAGIDSMRTGKWMVWGREMSSLMLPGWMVVLASLFIVFISGWVIVRFARKT